ncbi:NADP-dependent oxidoreductase domain-containing protein [Stachybotrys elegans]|uniref:NADP-dependent oxidoreductase domain-containing protein n=1 Tax=Stachybotrys elegans TaxID=80388 RepID=A0A8K0WLR9_9HYPO|nr:NADP-dependent oxidoreductase domain-containing protein [Stachybotrys elegans]
MTDKTFTLNDGNKIPAVGLGTWKSAGGEVQTAVSYALKNGYKLIDGAYCYANEDEVGLGLKEAFDAGVKREDIFVVTKIWATYMSRVELGLDKSLKSLGLDYVDLVLVHWPVLMNPEGNEDRFPTLPDGSRDILRDWNHVDGWKEMEKLPATGKTKSIGVSNYSKKYLDELLASCTIKPAVNQIENHPLLPQSEIVELCKEHNIHIMAYSPLGSTGSPLFKDEAIIKLAEKKGVTPATILISWHVANGRTVVPKSVKPERIEANKTVVEFDGDDLQVLKDYTEDINKRKAWERFVYPAFNIDFGFPDKS